MLSGPTSWQHGYLKIHTVHRYPAVSPCGDCNQLPSSTCCKEEPFHVAGTMGLWTSLDINPETEVATVFHFLTETPQKWLTSNCINNERFVCWYMFRKQGWGMHWQYISCILSYSLFCTACLQQNYTDLSELRIMSDLNDLCYHLKMTVTHITPGVGNPSEAV